MRSSARRAKPLEKAIVTVMVPCADWRKSVANPVEAAKAAAKAALRTARVKDSRALTVLLSDDANLEALNRKFRSKTKPTNVLSFPAPMNAEHYLGDIAIAYGVCAREAAERGILLSCHLSHLVVHGVLHLLGYDHETKQQAQIMEPLETEILAGMKIPDPYSSLPAAP